jgi:hypothetical protein
MCFSSVLVRTSALAMSTSVAFCGVSGGHDLRCRLTLGKRQTRSKERCLIGMQDNAEQMPVSSWRASDVSLADAMQTSLSQRLNGSIQSIPLADCRADLTLYGRRRTLPCREQQTLGNSMIFIAGLVGRSCQRRLTPRDRPHLGLFLTSTV